MTGVPSSYVPWIIFIAGELESLDIEETRINEAPVPVLGKIAGNAESAIKRNSSRTMIEGFDAKPLKLYKR